MLNQVTQAVGLIAFDRTFSLHIGLSNQHVNLHGQLVCEVRKRQGNRDTGNQHRRNKSFDHHAVEDKELEVFCLENAASRFWSIR